MTGEGWWWWCGLRPIYRDADRRRVAGLTRHRGGRGL